MDSLNNQTSKEFNVIFVDYGSDFVLSNKVEKVLEKYSFVKYFYGYNVDQPWNKSRAINFAINTTDKEFVFTADIDLIFHPRFVQKCKKMCSQETFITTYFQVGYLKKDEDYKKNGFDGYVNFSLSNHEATGLTLFSKEMLFEIGGYDEFYHFWGAEDTDVHLKIIAKGYQINYYDKDLILLHQWHKSYRAQEKKYLTNSLQLKGIVQLNYQYLHKIENKSLKLNNGKLMSKEQYQRLLGLESNFCIIENKVDVFDAWYYGVLLRGYNGEINVRFVDMSSVINIRDILKWLFIKKRSKFYSLKEINDKVLAYIISQNFNIYSYKVSENLNCIDFKLIREGI
ncbi:putative beta-glycosyltransferase Glycosyltransferase family 2 [Flavobacterium daejeonense]|nr:putative beta-glycosyltransferase Glycosyltransferase family 2 [Flavobacterium daejeonense]